MRPPVHAQSAGDQKRSPWLRKAVVRMRRSRAGCRAGTRAASARPSAARSCRSCRSSSAGSSACVVDRREARATRARQRLERRSRTIVAARAGDADDVREAGQLVADRREVGQRLRIDERDLRVAVRRAGTRARRDRTGTTAAPRSRPAGTRRGARRPSRGRCGRISATLSPRPTPRSASAFDEPVGLASARSQNVSAAVAPDSSSQYSAKRVRSPAQRRAARVRDVELRGHVPAMAGVKLGVAVGGHGRNGDAAIRGQHRRASAVRGIAIVSSRPSAAATVRSRGSTVAHTQSGCCSSSRPSLIGADRLRRLQLQPLARAGTRPRARSATARPRRPRACAARGTGPANVRPLIVVCSPSTE